MNKLIRSGLMIVLLSSCDPVAQMEANVENLTSQNLSIVFISSDTSLDKTLLIEPGQVGLFQEGFDIGSSFIEPSLIEYDSVFIKDNTGVILRIYKENSPGKNIYNVDDDWISREPSKRVFNYLYQIESEEIE